MFAPSPGDVDPGMAAAGAEGLGMLAMGTTPAGWLAAGSQVLGQAMGGPNVSGADAAGRQTVTFASPFNVGSGAGAPAASPVQAVTNDLLGFAVIGGVLWIAYKLATR